MAVDFIIETIQLKRANASTWTSTNPILLDGEAGFERDTNKLKIGDGSSTWSALSYITGSSLGQLSDLSDVNTSNPANKNFLIADGIDWESRQALLSDISDYSASKIQADLDALITNTRWRTIEVPAGGTTGQVLKKNSGTNYDVGWANDTAATTASSVSITDSGGFYTATEVEAAFQEIGYLHSNITVTQSVNLDTIESDTATNNAKVTNATHTGEVTGSTGLTIHPTAISGKSLVTAVATDMVLLWDATDSTLKRADVNDFLGSSGINNVVEDTTPELGGNLDALGNNIVNLDIVTFQTTTGTLQTNTNAADNLLINAYDVDGAQYVSVATITANNTPTLDVYSDSFRIGVLADPTKRILFDTIGATTSTSTTLTASQTANRVITFPDATTTLIGADSTATLTNKTFNANGTGNSLSNVDVADLANGTDGELITWNSSGAPTTVAVGTADQVLTSNGAGAAPTFQALPVELIVAVSDETTPLTTGTGKVTFRMPYAMTLSEVRASLTAAGGTSGTTTVDINESGSTILSTKLTIDQGEKTSETAAAAAVISDTALADDAEITIDIDAISGSGTEAGLKVTLIGTRT